MKLSLLLYFSKICLAHSAPLIHEALHGNASEPVTTGSSRLRDSLLYKKIGEALKARELAGAPRGYIDLRENGRLGPEGKIARPLIGSISGGGGGGISAGGSNSGSKFDAAPLPDYDASGRILATRRALPPSPVLRRDRDGQRYAVCFLLAAIATAAVLLLYAVRNLMSGRDPDTSVAPPYRKMSALATWEKVLFVALLALLFACLTAFLSEMFFERYHRSRRESNDLTFLTSQTECLNSLVQDSGRELCVFKDEFGREYVIRREIRPVFSENFDFWRRILAGRSSDDSEKVRVTQLRLLQSGILNKWFPKQRNIERLQISQEELRREDEPKRSQKSKFVHFVALITISGCLVVLIVFLAERFVRHVKMQDRSLQYIYLE